MRCMYQTEKMSGRNFSNMLLLLLNRFSRVRLCVTPEMAAHRAPPSLGFSRQEHWSGLPFSFSNTWKWKVKVKSLSCVWLIATPWTAAYQAPPSMDFPGKSTGVGCHCLLQNMQYSYTHMCVHDFMCVCSCMCMCVDKDSLFDQTGVSLPNLLLGPLPCKI